MLTKFYRWYSNLSLSYCTYWDRLVKSICCSYLHLPTVCLKYFFKIGKNDLLLYSSYWAKSYQISDHFSLTYLGLTCGTSAFLINKNRFWSYYSLLWILKPICLFISAPCLPSALDSFFKSNSRNFLDVVYSHSWPIYFIFIFAQKSSTGNWDHRYASFIK